MPVALGAMKFVVELVCSRHVIAIVWVVSQSWMPMIAADRSPVALLSVICQLAEHPASATCFQTIENPLLADPPEAINSQGNVQAQTGMDMPGVAELWRH